MSYTSKGMSSNTFIMKNGVYEKSQIGPKADT